MSVEKSSCSGSSSDSITEKMTKPATIFYDVCKKCVQRGRSCCKGNCIPLTQSDIERIVALGHSPEFFVVAAEYGREFVHDVEDFEQWWKESFITIGDNHYKLNMKKGDDDDFCVFLKPGVGCSLGENRPAICRLYPFWVMPSNELSFESTEYDYCLMAESRMNVGDALEQVKESEGSAREYFEVIRNDCLVGREFHTTMVTSLLARVEE